MDISNISIKGRSPNKGFAIFQVRTKDIPGKNSSVIANAQKIIFFINDFYSMWDQTDSLLRIWSHLLKRSLMENVIFWAMLFPKK